MKTRTQAVKELKEQMRGAGLDEVRAKRRELSDHLFRLRFQMAGGQSDTLRKIRELRRDIARVETILGEREAEKR
jgi:large subunit ribosomal protein L29